jgi:multimeric flavodoxin WrbA
MSKRNRSRREVLAAATVVLPAAAAQTRAGAKLKIIGVSCSARKDKTTAAAVKACLEAAKSANPAIEIEFIDLGGLQMQGDLAAGVPLAEGERDDFPAVEAKMRAEGVAGIVVGTPVYFSGMSSLCKQFLDRWMTFRTNFVLRNVVGGAIAVGAARNGGQELTLQSIHAAMLCQDMIIVSEGMPTSRLGGMLVSAKDEIRHDEAGLNTARSLGRRVGEVAQLVRN